MSRTSIRMSQQDFDSIRHHLLPPDGLCEEAAFLCAKSSFRNELLRLDVVDVLLIPPEGFASRSPCYLELRDTTRAKIIKKAHELGASLIECHSHPSQVNACFSWSDLHGFDACVPNFMWRLKERPYAAVVLARHSFDGLVWSGAGERCVPLREIVTERLVLHSTGLTHARWDEIYDKQPI